MSMGDKKANSRPRNCVSCRRTFPDFHLLARFLEGFRISRDSGQILSEFSINPPLVSGGCEITSLRFADKVLFQG